MRWSLNADPFEEDAAEAPVVGRPSFVAQLGGGERALAERMRSLDALHETVFVDVRLAGFEGDGEHELQLSEEALRAMREHRLAVGVIIRTVRDSVEALRTGLFVPESATETEDGYRSMRDAFRMLLPWPRGEDVEEQVRGVTLRRGVQIAVGERAFELLRKDDVSGSWVCVGVDPVGPERLLRLSGRGASTWRLY